MTALGILVYHYAKLARLETRMETKFDSTADAVASALRELIVVGELGGGERLVERDLAERFEVSRIPLREAIQQLAREGLVEIFRNRGAVVRMLTAQDVEEIYGLRVLLEGDAIFRSVKRLDDETLARAELVHRLLGEAHRARSRGARRGAGLACGLERTSPPFLRHFFLWRIRRNSRLGASKRLETPCRPRVRPCVRMTGSSAFSPA